MSKNEKTDITRIDELSTYEHLEDDSSLNLDSGQDILDNKNRNESSQVSNIDFSEETDQVQDSITEEAFTTNQNNDSQAFDSQSSETVTIALDAEKVKNQNEQNQEINFESLTLQENPNIGTEEPTIPTSDSLSFMRTEDSSQVASDLTLPNSSSPFSEDVQSQEAQTQSFSIEEENSQDIKKDTTDFIEEQISKKHAVDESKGEGISKRSDLEEIRSFGQNLTYGKVKVGGNPPFSLLIQNIKSNDDANKILSILKEHDLAQEESLIRQGLDTTKSVLISQISEYSAIFLAHKLKPFDLDIQVGPSQKVRPSQSYSDEDAKGFILASEENCAQNKEEDGIS